MHSPEQKITHHGHHYEHYDHTINSVFTQHFSTVIFCNLHRPDIKQTPDFEADTQSILSVIMHALKHDSVHSCRLFAPDSSDSENPRVRSAATGAQKGQTF